MELLTELLPWIQITLAILLTVLILVQQRGAGAGGAFGGADGTIHFERRGFEKSLFKFTGILAFAFVLSVLAQTLVKDTTADYYTDSETPAIVDIQTSTTNDVLEDLEEETKTTTSPSDLIDFEISNQDVQDGTLSDIE